MLSKLSASALAVMLILAAALPNALAQYAAEINVSMEVWTDKNSYTPGEAVSINVSVQPATEEPITLTVVSPEDSIWIQERVFADENGNASYTFSLGEDAPEGAWLVNATYMDTSSQAEFSFSKPQQYQPPPQEPAYIRLSTDKPSYKLGESVRINAEVGPASREAVVISITGSDAVTYFERSVLPDRGVVELKFVIGKDHPVGEWIVRGAYIDAYAEITFSVLAEPAQEKEPPAPPQVKPSITMSVLIDRSEYRAGERVGIQVTIDSTEPVTASELTISVFGPGYSGPYSTEKGKLAFAFPILKDYPAGDWFVRANYKDVRAEASFTVIETVPPEAGAPEPEPPAPPSDFEFTGTGYVGKAVMKNLKKTSLISFKNTGATPIDMLFIKVDQGSIPFVKAKKWERARLSDNAISLTATTPLKAGQSMIILLKWKDRPDFEKMEIGGIPITGVVETLPDDKSTLIDIYVPSVKITPKVTPEIPEPKPEAPKLPEWKFDKGMYLGGEKVSLSGSASASSSLTMVVLDHHQEILLEKEVKAGTDGHISFSFTLPEDATLGFWSVIIKSGSATQEVMFEVTV